jgi:hypothetical protein
LFGDGLQALPELPQHLDAIARQAAARVNGPRIEDGETVQLFLQTGHLREAGGVITNADGTPFDRYTPDAVASNGPL